MWEERLQMRLGSDPLNGADEPHPPGAPRFPASAGWWWTGSSSYTGPRAHTPDDPVLLLLPYKEGPRAGRRSRLVVPAQPRQDVPALTIVPSEQGRVGASRAASWPG